LESNAEPRPIAHAAPSAVDGSRDDYEDGVRSILGSIRRGDVYQANLAWRGCVPAPSDPLETWLALREDNPSERGAFLDRGDVAVISNSPELFLRVRARRGRRLAGARRSRARPRSTRGRSGSRRARRSARSSR
jgi:anthranilate/para-aminobenzoate synthase component I